MFLKYPDNVLKKLQEEEREIVADIHRFCKENDIGYFAVGGTLIGAVRHHDFIPWDDDIDLGMLREDFDRFIERFEKEYGDKYEICCPDTKNRYYSFVPKIAKKGTLFETDLARRSDVTDMGIFAEIFVFENVSADKSERAKQIRSVNRIKNLYNARMVKRPVAYDAFPLNAAKVAVKYAVKVYTLLRGLNGEKLNAMYLGTTKSDASTDYAAYFGDMTTEDFLTKKEELFPLQEVDFGSIKIMIPANYDKLLTQAYGDYMQVPPEDKRWNQAPLRIRFSDGEEIDFQQ